MRNWDKARRMLAVETLIKADGMFVVRQTQSSGDENTFYVWAETNHERYDLAVACWTRDEVIEQINLMFEADDDCEQIVGNDQEYVKYGRDAAYDVMSDEELGSIISNWTINDSSRSTLPWFQPASDGTETLFVSFI